jgi:2-oxoisovalerate dehydrogenase E1 component beta subunit
VPELSIAEALHAAVRQALRTDPRALAFDQNTGAARFGGRVTDGLGSSVDEARVFRVALTESGVINLGIGLAMHGWHPILEIERCSADALSGILSDLASVRARGGGAYDVQLTLCVPSFSGAAQVEDQATSGEALFAHTPGLKVVTPGTSQGAFDLLLAAVNDPDPVLFIQPLNRYQDRQEVDLAATGQQLGQATLLRDGDQATLVTWGAMVKPCLHVADAAAADGVSVQVLDVRSLIPLDNSTLQACTERTGRVIVVHDGPFTAGFGAEVAARLMEGAWADLRAPVLRVAGMDVPYPPPAYQDAYHPSRDQIRQTLLRVLDPPARAQLTGRGRLRDLSRGGTGARPQKSAEDGHLFAAAQ